MQQLFLKHPAAPVLAGIGLGLFIAIALLSFGAFSTVDLPRGFSSRQQLLGANLLLILIPAYLTFAWGHLTRRSLVLLRQVDELIGVETYAPLVETPVTTMLTGVVLGGLYAVLFNLPVGSIEDLMLGGPLLVCLVFFMILVWLTVGVVLSSRIHVARVFRRAGRQVPIDLYDQSPLEPFARSGMGDVLMTVGALVLTTVQSIDATLRYENYFFSMLVGVPAGLTLLFLPMSTLHTRLKAKKLAERAAVNDLISAAPKTLTTAQIVALEPLLQRRDRIQDLHTWPLNIAMISRLLIYGVIPPAAWAGAALTERMIEDLLGGG